MCSSPGDFRKAKFRKKTEEVVDSSDIGDCLNLWPTYSSGMVMSLSFFTASSVKTGIFFIDEWFSVGCRFYQEGGRPPEGFAQHDTDLGDGFPLFGNSEEGLNKVCCLKGEVV